jgi:hypothetical protein
MAIEITVYASDIRGLDDTIEDVMDISNYYGSALFNKEGRLCRLDQYEYHISPTCYLGLMMSQQEQITDLQEIVENLVKEVRQLKKIVGWSSGYDDNEWKPLHYGEYLSTRIEKLEKEVEKL